MSKQRKGRRRVQGAALPTDPETALHDVLAALHWQEQLVRHVLRQMQNTRLGGRSPGKAGEG